jgi:hypothetical protein
VSPALVPPLRVCSRCKHPEGLHSDSDGCLIDVAEGTAGAVMVEQSQFWCCGCLGFVRPVLATVYTFPLSRDSL